MNRKVERDENVEIPMKRRRWNVERQTSRQPGLDTRRPPSRHRSEPGNTLWPARCQPRSARAGWNRWNSTTNRPERLKVGEFENQSRWTTENNLITYKVVQNLQWRRRPPVRDELQQSEDAGHRYEGFNVRLEGSGLHSETADDFTCNWTDYQWIINGLSMDYPVDYLQCWRDCRAIRWVWLIHENWCYGTCSPATAAYPSRALADREKGSGDDPAGTAERRDPNPCRWRWKCLSKKL